MSRNKTKLMTAIAVASALTSSAALAIDGFSGDYTPLPPGTSMGLLYLQYNNGETLDISGQHVPSSELDYLAVTGRFIHYTELYGHPAMLQAYLPIVDFLDPKAGDVSLPTDDGLGDLTLGATFWLLASDPSDATGTTLGATLFVTLPTGDYEFGEVSSGSGTTTFTPQLGFQQGLGGGLFLDAYYDIAFALDHDENGSRVSTDRAQQLQTYLRFQHSPRTSFSLGYSGQRGGKQHVDGTYVSAKTEKDTIRIGAKTMVTDTLQIAGRIDYDINVDDGFKSEPLYSIRLLKLF